MHLWLFWTMAACTGGSEEERTIDRIVDGLAGKKDIESAVPRTCKSDNGQMYVVWQDDRNDPNLDDKKHINSVFINSSSDGGVTWLPSPIQLNNPPPAVDGTVSATNPAVACAGDTVYVVWEDERDGDLKYKNIYLDYSTNGGREFLQEDIMLDADETGSAMSLSPQIFAVGDAAYVTWFDQVNGAYDIFMRSTVDRGEHWGDAPVRVDGDEEGSAYSANPRLTADGGGGVVVTWEDRRNGNSDIFVAFSGDNGRSFMPDIRLDGGEAGEANSFLPQIAQNGTSVYVVWHDERNGASDVFMNSSGDGGVNWQVEPFRVDSDSEGVNDSLNPRVAATSKGAGVVWQDNRLGGNDIYFRLTPNGGGEWSGEEVRMDTDAGGSAQSFDPAVISEGDKVVVGWREFRDDSEAVGNNDIYYNYSEDGGKTWPNNDIIVNSSIPGITYATDLSLQLEKEKLSAFWTDGRSGWSRIYIAQYKLGDGGIYVPPKE